MKRRLYALFERIDGKWVRRSENAYPIQTARKVFQGWLLANSQGERRLRPVPMDQAHRTSLLTKVWGSEEVL